MTDFNDEAKGVFRRVEVLTGAGRRRRWSDEQKMQNVAEAMVPGAVVSQIARRWQICPSQVFTRRRAASGDMARRLPSNLPAFVPIVEVASVPALASPTLEAARVPEIEIDTGGAKIQLACGVDTKALTAVLRAVRAASS